MAKQKRPEGHAALQAKYLELARKYAALVDRAGSRPEVVAVSASTAARLASVGVAVLDTTGKVLQGSLRWQMMVPPSLARSLTSLQRQDGERKATVRQYRAPGRGGATLVIRIEHIDGISLAIATEEASAFAAEDDRSRRRLWQSERLRVLGQLAASVAHDLSSTLRSARYLLSSLEADELLRRRSGETLAAMARGLDDSSSIVGRLHDFARTGAQPVQLVQIPTVLGDAIKLYQLETQARGGGPQVILRSAPVAAVHASPGELTHVFLNLLRNAREATSGQEQIVVRCVSFGNMVRVSVADRGSGLQSSDLARVFEPFFTTKGEKGTGLGLFICASVIERIGGSIRASKRQDGGAIFTVELPSVSAPSTSADQPPARHAEDRLASPPSPRGRRARPRSSAG